MEGTQERNNAFNAARDEWITLNTQYKGEPLTDREKVLAQGAAVHAWNAALEWVKKRIEA